MLQGKYFLPLAYGVLPRGFRDLPPVFFSFRGFCGPKIVEVLCNKKRGVIFQEAVFLHLVCWGWAHGIQRSLQHDCACRHVCLLLPSSSWSKVRTYKINVKDKQI